MNKHDWKKLKVSRTESRDAHYNNHWPLRYECRKCGLFVFLKRNHGTC